MRHGHANKVGFSSPKDTFCVSFLSDLATSRIHDVKFCTHIPCGNVGHQAPWMYWPNARVHDPCLEERRPRSLIAFRFFRYLFSATARAWISGMFTSTECQTAHLTSSDLLNQQYNCNGKRVHFVRSNTALQAFRNIPCIFVTTMLWLLLEKR